MPFLDRTEMQTKRVVLREGFGGEKEPMPAGKGGEDRR